MQQFNFTCSLMPGTPGSTDIIDEVFLVTVSATRLSRLRKIFGIFKTVLILMRQNKPNTYPHTGLCKPFFVVVVYLEAPFLRKLNVH